MTCFDRRRISRIGGSGTLLAAVVWLAVACVRAQERPPEWIADRDGKLRAAGQATAPDPRTVVARRLGGNDWDLADPERTCAWLAANDFDAVALDTARELPDRWIRALARSGLGIMRIDEIPAHARYVDLITPGNEAELNALFEASPEHPAWIEARIPPLPSFPDLEMAFADPDDSSVREAFRERADLELAAKRFCAAAWRGVIDAAHRRSSIRLVIEGVIAAQNVENLLAHEPPPVRSAADSTAPVAARVLGPEGLRASIRSLGIDVSERATDRPPRITLCGDLRGLWQDGALFDRILAALEEVRDHGGTLVFLAPPERDNPLVRYGLLPAYELVGIDRALHAAVPSCAAALRLERGILSPAFAECLPRAAFLTTPTADQLVVSIDLRGGKLGCAVFRERVGNGYVVLSTFPLLHALDRFVAPRLWTRRFLEYVATWHSGAPEDSSSGSLSGDVRAWSAEQVRERYERDRVEAILRQNTPR